MSVPNSEQAHGFETRVRVRYADTDQMGVVHHARFFEYFEQGRSDWLRESGLSYRQLEREGLLLVVTEAHARYRAPAFYDDLLTVRTTLGTVRRASLTLHYEVRRHEQLLVAGATTLAALDAARRPRRLPPALLERLQGRGPR